MGCEEKNWIFSQATAIHWPFPSASDCLLIYMSILLSCEKKTTEKRDLVIFGGEGSDGKFNDFKLITSWWFCFVDASLVLNINAHLQRSSLLDDDEKTVSLIPSRDVFFACNSFIVLAVRDIFPSPWIFNFNLYGLSVLEVLIVAGCAKKKKHKTRPSFTSIDWSILLCSVAAMHGCTKNSYMIVNNWALKMSHKFT